MNEWKEIKKNNIYKNFTNFAKKKFCFDYVRYESKYQKWKKIK